MASRGRWERLFLFSLPLALVVYDTNGIFEHIFPFVVYTALLLNIFQFNETQERNKRATFFSATVLLLSLSDEMAAALKEFLVVIKPKSFI